MQQMVDQMDTPQSDTAKPSSCAMEDDSTNSDAIENSSTISRVCQRVTANDDSFGEIWALIEFEIPNPEMPEAEPLRVYKKWRRFETESELSDFIRRDSGEPLTLPPYSLSPAQSQRIQEESRKSVSQVTEEFRRFRVRAEVARKQADAQIRDLQSNKVQSAKRRIEGQDLVSRGETMGRIVVLSVITALFLHDEHVFRRKLSWNRLEQNMNSSNVFEQKWRRRRRNGRRRTTC